MIGFGRPRRWPSAAERTVLMARPDRAHVVLELAVQILGFHIDGARPIFRSICHVDEFVEQLFIPGIEFDFGDGPVEILDFDGLILVVDGDHFEELVGIAAIPLTYDRLHKVHGPSPSAMLESIELSMNPSRNRKIWREATTELDRTTHKILRRLLRRGRADLSHPIVRGADGGCERR